MSMDKRLNLPSKLNYGDVIVLIQIINRTFVHWFKTIVAEGEEDDGEGGEQEEGEDQMLPEQQDPAPESGRRRIPQTALARQVNEIFLSYAYNLNLFCF